MVNATFALFPVDPLDSNGTLVGASHHAGLLQNGKLPYLKRAPPADSNTIPAGATLGTSSTNPYVENTANVSTGCHTDLNAAT
ncbi:NCS2 family permease, partial [Neisseria sp. P0016.S006]